MNYEKKVDEFLNEQLIMHLATSAAETPWVCAVEFVHDKDLNLYWRSDADSLHTRNLLSNPQCALAITLLFANNDGEGIQAKGTASVIKDAETISALKARIDSKRNKAVSEEVSEKEETREYWKFSPSQMFYINEPVLGYNRVEIQLPK